MPRTGHCYIGSTINLWKRSFVQHKNNYKYYPNKYKNSIEELMKTDGHSLI